MPKKIRIDQLLVSKGQAESRAKAQRLVMAGQVRVDGQVVPKPSSMVLPDAKVVVAERPRFVSRGGEKLEAAFIEFNLTVDGLVCADVGASTGGFTDCLLQHKATKVFCIDVGQGILHWKLRNHPRIVIMEGINARYVPTLPEPVCFVTIDVSFISLKVILPVIKAWFPKDEDSINHLKSGNRGEAIALIKPQFEAGRKEVARGKGVIRDPKIHQQILNETLAFAREVGFSIRGLMQSPITGPKGNIEFLVWLQLPTKSDPHDISISNLVSQVLHLDQ